MNTKILEYIFAIAEERSVTRAAERFYLSHAALSRHLKNIETELDARLFTRTAAGMQPTQAGLIFMNDARAILHQEQALEQKLAAMRRQRQQVIRVLEDTPCSNIFVRQVIPRFSQMHPYFTLEVKSDNASGYVRALNSGQASLAVVFTTAPRSAEVSLLPFVASSLRCVFPPDYQGPTDAEGVRAALATGMFLILYQESTMIRQIEEQRLAALRIYPEKVLAGATANIIHHVSAGNTCGFLPEIFVNRARQAGLVVGDVFTPMYQTIAYARDAVLSPAAQDLMQIIIEVFSAK